MKSVESRGILRRVGVESIVAGGGGEEEEEDLEVESTDIGDNEDRLEKDGSEDE